MYVPAAFREDDPAILAAFMAANSFALLVTGEGGACVASHVPVLHRPGPGQQGVLWLHLARANPQARHLEEGREVLVVFQGPHAYVSPTWYATAPAVPTWNYTAVHAYGVPEVVRDKDRVVAMLEATVAAYEVGREGAWDGKLPEAYRDRMIEGITGVEIRITRLEGKWKLGQNRSEADRLGVYRALVASADAGDRACAEAMRRAGLVPGV